MTASTITYSLSRDAMQPVCASSTWHGFGIAKADADGYVTLARRYAR